MLARLRTPREASPRRDIESPESYVRRLEKDRERMKKKRTDPEYKTTEKTYREREDVREKTNRRRAKWRKNDGPRLQESNIERRNWSIGEITPGNEEIRTRLEPGNRIREAIDEDGRLAVSYPLVHLIPWRYARRNWNKCSKRSKQTRNHATMCLFSRQHS